jgi:hypothetical protein
MILSGILSLLSWPALIFVTYWLIKLALKKYESKLEEED